MTQLPPPRANEPVAWLPDTVIEDRFLIVRELGHGGMGAVYFVFDRDICRELAIKRIHPGGVGVEEHEERFRREYRALASIRDPGVPQVHHSGRTADGVAWFTMEAIRGESLRAILERDMLGPARALDLAIKLAKILAVAHEAGVIHRDVKPANIMVEPGDRVCLLDFGVCTALPRFLRAAESRRRTGQAERWRSSEDNFAGTIGYSDPLTHDGSAATVRSDIYSVGVILYEMLTGRRHCDPDSLVCRSIDSAEFPVALAPLADDLRRAVAHNHFERHRTMAELVQRLEIARGLLARAQAEVEVPTPRPPISPLLLGLVLGIGATALALAFRRPHDPHAAPPVTVASPTHATAVASPTPVTAFSPTPVTAFSPTPVTTVCPSPPAAIAVAPPAPAPAAIAVPGPLESPSADATASRVKSSQAHPSHRFPALTRLLDAHTPAIRRCMARYGSPLDRELTVSLSLDAAGHIDACNVTPGAILLDSCVARELADLSFAPGTPSPRTHTFRIPAP